MTDLAPHGGCWWEGCKICNPIAAREPMKYVIDQIVYTTNEDGSHEEGTIKAFLGDGWYTVRIDGLDEMWHDEVIEGSR